MNMYIIRCTYNIENTKNKIKTLIKIKKQLNKKDN